MQITSNSFETIRSPDDWSTGDVYIDTIASPSDMGEVPSRALRAMACARATSPRR